MLQTKRILSLLMALVMVMSLLPVPVFAAETESLPLAQGDDVSYVYRGDGSGDITVLATDGQKADEYSDFTLEYDVSFDGSNLDTGIMFRMDETTNPDNPHGYFLGFYNEEIRILDGKDWSIPVRVSFVPQRGRTYHVKLEANGSSIKGYVDDMTTPVITFNDSRYTSGALALRNYRGTQYADNITVDGVLVDDFESGTNDKWYAMKGTSWRVEDKSTPRFYSHDANQWLYFG